MKKSLLSLGLTAILTVVGASSALAVPGDSTSLTVTQAAPDYTRNIAGANKAGKITLQSQGLATAELWQACPGRGDKLLNLNTSPSKVEDSSVVYMQEGCFYYAKVTSYSSSSATVYLRNFN
ncbi:hypothetical protein P4H65_23480 [Paenibacillus chitinolyticus]|uniref:hypothetical protein n=1 Tax=Paenibacillus chitinolyticus TaxID=79263 RepID=UPI002DB61BB0|nr:hypothetical protein [Paenibacillus chitinolyticus]MEC0248757.1 hypothetical protein [Paenibacillus chitinolyticus]